jgi:hypothetical protein
VVLLAAASRKATSDGFQCGRIEDLREARAIARQRMKEGCGAVDVGSCSRREREGAGQQGRALLCIEITPVPPIHRRRGALGGRRTGTYSKVGRQLAGRAEDGGRVLLVCV